MGDTPQKPSGEFSLLQLLPNMLTVAAICAGLSAIRFGVQGNYTLAVLLIILAGVLDGVDGRLARALGSSSKIGAELDSLADFLNFGVVPAVKPGSSSSASSNRRALYHRLRFRHG